MAVVSGRPLTRGDSHSFHGAGPDRGMNAFAVLLFAFAWHCVSALDSAAVSLSETSVSIDEGESRTLRWTLHQELEAGDSLIAKLTGLSAPLLSIDPPGEYSQDRPDARSLAACKAPQRFSAAGSLGTGVGMDPVVQ